MLFRSHYTMLDLSGNWQNCEAVTPEAVSAIEKIPGVDKVQIIESKAGMAGIGEETIERFFSYFETQMQGRMGVEEMLGGVKESGEIPEKAFHIAEDLYASLENWEGTFDREKFEQGGTAVLLVDIFSKNWASIGDKLTLKGEGTKPDKEVEIVASAQLTYSIGTRGVTLGGISLLLCEKDFKELYNPEGADRKSVV